MWWRSICWWWGVIGDTLLRFAKQNPSYKRIIAFEPDNKNLDMLYWKTKKVANLSIIESGLSDGNGTANFRMDSAGMYKTHFSIRKWDGVIWMD